jgi:large subunit ribosomal protein L30
MSQINNSPTTRIAVIRIRGSIDRSFTIKRTLNLLRLNRTNHCVIIDDRKTYKGMLQRAKDTITWGELDFDTLKFLLLKRGRLAGRKKLTEDYIKENSNFQDLDEFITKYLEFKADFTDIKGLKPVFRLHPPRKGHNIKGVKKPFTLSGALGYRGKQINELISKMA